MYAFLANWPSTGSVARDLYRPETYDNETVRHSSLTTPLAPLKQKLKPECCIMNFYLLTIAETVKTSFPMASVNQCRVPAEKVLQVPFLIQHRCLGRVGDFE